MSVFTLEDVLGAAAKLDMSRKNTGWLMSYDENEEPVWSVMEDGEIDGCRYADPRDLTKPDCFVGTVIHDLTPEAFALIADEESSASPDYGTFWMVVDTVAEYTPEAKQFLYRVQGYADEGRTWGEAIAAVEALS